MLEQIINILIKAGMKKRVVKYFVNMVKDELDVMNIENSHNNTYLG
ncbi:MAG: hypothetical protein QW128_01120 [Thermoprotei archaeon]